jgi:hypothetical protein
MGSLATPTPATFLSHTSSMSALNTAFDMPGSLPDRIRLISERSLPASTASHRSFFGLCAALETDLCSVLDTLEDP